MTLKWHLVVCAVLHALLVAIITIRQLHKHRRMALKGYKVQTHASKNVFTREMVNWSSIHIGKAKRHLVACLVKKVVLTNVD